MIVYNAEPYGYSKKGIALWRKKGYSYSPGSWQEVDNKTAFPKVEILIVRLQRKVTSNVLNKFPDVKKIISATTGWDHLDIDAIKARNIDLVTLRGQNEFLKTIPSTAEHTWALMMALIRNIPAANRDVLAGNWNRDDFRGYELKGKTIGIIGYGRTGQQVAKYADAFQMKVLFYDPYVEHKFEGHLKVNTLEKLLQQSDIVSLHVHLVPETKNLLNARNISELKNGAYLVNTSRGKVWDEEAVMKALEQKSINGVATDVLSTELDEISKSSLWKGQQEGKNIIITPHIGGATWDAMWACEEFMISI